MKFGVGYTLALTALAGTACAQVSNVGVAADSAQLAVAPPQLQRVLSQPAPEQAVTTAQLARADPTVARLPEASNNVEATMARWVVQNLSKFNGESIIGFIENLTGDDIINAIAAMDESTVSTLADVASSVPLVQAFVGEDLSKELGSLSGVNGQQLLDAFAAMDGETLYNLISQSGVANLAQSFGVSPELLKGSLQGITGQDIIDLVRQFNGHDFIDFVSKLNGEMIVEWVNDSVNDKLTDIRSKAAVSVNAADPGEYNGFDILTTLRSVQSFLSDVTGVQIPDLTIFVTSFDGKRLIEGIRSMTTADVLSTVNIFAPVMTSMATMSGNDIAMNISEFLQSIVNYFATSDGAKLIEDLRSLNFEKFVSLLEALQKSVMYQKIVGIDLQPFIEAFAQIDGETIVAGIQNTKGSRILQMLSEMGTLDYLSTVPGFDAAAFEAQVEQFDGATLIQSVSQMTQPEVVAQINNVGEQMVGAGRALVAL